MRRRRGHSLMELLIAITISSALMALAVGLLHLAFGVEESCREGQNRQGMLARLAEQVRQDAHAAEAWSVDVAQGRWQFRFGPGHEAVYQRESERLLRSETIAGQVRYESFAIPAEVRVECQMPSEGTRLLTLHLQCDSSSPGNPIWKETRIEACLGLNQRLPVVPDEAGAGR